MRSRRSFYRGMDTFFSLGRTENKNRVYKSNAHSDLIDIYNTWRRVGEDIINAKNKFDREHSNR